jgi:hypothetical protein
VRTAALLVLLLPAAALAAAPVKDEWTRVPALPTACYQSDGYGAKLDTADAAAEGDLSAQEKTNQALQEKVKTIDPMELAQRQQQYMMDHPQEAMALMQRNASLGENFSDAVVEHANAGAKLEEELKAIDGRYQAALDKALAPIKQKFDDLDVRAKPHLVLVGEIGYDYPAWAIKEWNVITRQENVAYEKVCAEWWSATGPYRGWLQRYREHLVQGIPKWEEAENVGAGFMVWIVGTPTESFKPTATLRAVGEYMDQVAKVYGKRWTEPNEPRESMIGPPPPK